MTAVTLAPHPRRGVGKPGGYNIRARVRAVVLLFSWCSLQQTGLLFGNHIVDASSLVIFLPNPLGANAFEVRLRGGCVV